MAATFGTPIAAVLLTVELLLFEWKPRSFIPVALASAVAALMRSVFQPYSYLNLGPDPLFAATPPHGFLDITTLLSAIPVGLLGGVLALLLTLAVYGAEDAFHRLPIHWMWWPAIGGLIVGLGGYFQPKALGVGYENIETMLQGNYHLGPLLSLLLVKALIWSLALGWGTSGGVLAPLLILGGALGAVEYSLGLPGGDARLWPLVSMAAVMGGTMRSPLTGVLFALELMHDTNALPPLLIATAFSYAFTVLVMKRSILTEKVSRRGFHVSREYSVDPLERLSLGDVMSTKLVTIPANLPVRQLMDDYFLATRPSRHQGYPVVDCQGKLLGLITRTNLLEQWVTAALAGTPEATPGNGAPIITYDLLAREPITAFPWESCRTAAERMAQAQVGRLPVVSPDEPGQVVGIVTRSDLLKARARILEEEMQRERFIGPNIFQGASRAD